MTRKTPRHGQVSPERAAQMKTNLPERYHAVIDLLTVRPQPVRASASRSYDDGDAEFDAEFAHLWPGAAADRRERVAASARRELTEAEIYSALWPDEQP